MTFHSAVLLLFMVVLCGTRASAQDQSPPTLLSAEGIEARIAAIAAQTDLDPSVKERLGEDWKAALAALRSADAAAAAAAKWAEEIALLPERVQRAKARLAEENPPSLRASLEAQDDAALAATEERATAERAAAERAEVKLKEEALANEARRKELVQLLADKDKRLEDLRAAAAEKVEGLSADRLEARQAARSQALRQGLLETEAHERELTYLGAIQEWQTLRQELAARDAGRAIQALRDVVAVRDDRRQREAKDREQRARAALERLDQEVAPLRAAIVDNAALTAENARLAQAKSKAEDAIRDNEDTLARIAAAREAAERRIEVVGLTEEVGRLLRRDRGEFPRVEVLSRRLENARRERAALAYQRIEREDEARKLGTDSAKSARTAMEPLKASLDADALAAAQDRLKALLDERRRDLATHRQTSLELAEALSARIATLERLVAATDSWFAFIDQRILWIRSAEPIHISPWSKRAEALVRPWTPEALASLPSSWRAVSTSSWLVLGGSILGGLLLLLRFVPYARSATVQARKGRSITPSVLSGTAVLLQALPFTLPFALATFVFGALDPAPGTVPAGLRDASWASAMFLGAVMILCGVARPRGLGEAHFGWDADRTARLRRALITLAWWSTPLLFIEIFYERTGDDAAIAEIARPALVLRSLATAWFLRTILHPLNGLLAADRRDDQSTAPTFAAKFAGVVPPLLFLAVALASVFGYHFTAARITERLELSGAVLAGIIIANAYLLRALVIARRRLSIRRATEGSTVKDVSEEGSSGRDATMRLGEGHTSVDAIDAQSRLLVRLSVLTVAFLSAYWIWGDLLPAIRILDQVDLWTTSVEQSIERKDPSTGAVAKDLVKENVPVTLEDLLVALLIGFGAILGVRNLPGILEVALLQHLPMPPSARYAVHSIVRQLLAIVGIAWVLGQLGLHWESIQWLVAAMGVGLGFGLQEIFANFVSGLIVLFERRVRIGDVVTVGEISGTVARVQTLATTIIDWDRKEFILPNKDLVTGRVLNWTRTDTISRLVLPVGISYQCDPERARAVMLQVAANHPLVLQQPAPLAVFESFGDSAVNLSLRCFVGNISQRLQAQTEILDGIFRRFREEGISIPYPQRDITLRGEAIERLLQPRADLPPKT